MSGLLLRDTERELEMAAAEFEQDLEVAAADLRAVRQVPVSRRSWPYLDEHEWASAKFESPTDGKRGVLTTDDLGHETAGKFAELIILSYYLRQRFAAIFGDRLFFDNEILNISGVPQRDIGKFLEIEPVRARSIQCECQCPENRTVIVKPFYAALKHKPDILDLAWSEFYEIKPDTDKGKSDGEVKIKCDREILDCAFRFRSDLGILTDRLPGPIRAGTTFVPPKRHVIFSGVLAPNLPPLTVTLETRLLTPALIVYKYGVEPELPLEALKRLADFLRSNVLPRIKKQLEEQFKVFPKLQPALATEQGSAEQAQTVIKQLVDEFKRVPNPPQRSLDLYSEVARRLISVDKILAYGVFMLVAPVLVVVASRLPVITPAVMRMASAFVTYLTTNAQAAWWTGRLGLRFALAVAEATAAESATQEARQASSAQRQRAANRAAQAAARALQNSREAQEAQRQLAQRLPLLVQAQERLRDAIWQSRMDFQREGISAETMAQWDGATAQVMEAVVENAGKAQALSQMAQAASGEASAVANGALLAARSVGGIPGGTALPAGCQQATAAIAKMYRHWQRNPRRNEVSLASSQVQALAGGATQLQIVNQSGYRVLVVVGPPSCHSLIVAPNSTQTVDVVPGQTHELGAEISDPRVRVPLFPSYGGQIYQKGWLYRMNVQPVRF